MLSSVAFVFRWPPKELSLLEIGFFLEWHKSLIYWYDETVDYNDQIKKSFDKTKT